MNTCHIHPRTMADEVPELSRSFLCILITGTGQAGKSTILKNLMPDDMECINLDD